MSSPSEQEKYPTVYVGPNSSKLGLVRFNHYLEINPVVQKAIDAHPALQMLFIPLEEFRDRAPQIYAKRDNRINHVTANLAKTGVL